MAQGQGEGPSASLRAWVRSHPARRQEHEGGPASRGMPAAFHSIQLEARLLVGLQPQGHPLKS